VVTTLSEAQQIPRFQSVAYRLVNDFPYFAKRCLKVRPKAGGLVPFRLNNVQMIVHRRLEEQKRDKKKVRALILKARQPGVSTYVEGRFFHQVINQRGVGAYILTHIQDATDTIFGMTKRFHEYMPAAIQPVTKSANAKQLWFSELDSGIEVSTAGAKGAGRGTTIQYFHGSEVAHWTNASEHMAGVMQAVPKADGTEVILESTANGVEGLFYDMCMDALSGKSDYQLIFVPWFDHEEYQSQPPEGWKPHEELAEYGQMYQLPPERLFWMYNKNREVAIAHSRDPEKISWIFRQEYPATIAEAFQSADHDSFIRPELVLRARKAQLEDQSAFPLILGVDTARGGGAKTHIVDRRGRCAGHLVDEAIDTEDTMEIVGRLTRLMERHHPDAVFIDCTNNPAIYDRMRELGHKTVHAVNFGSGAYSSTRYANKRAEMAGACAEWFEEGADIPDSDEWQADLCATGYSEDSLGRLKLEAKPLVVKRVKRTLDRADALWTTFAEPVRLTADKERARPRVRKANSGYSARRFWRFGG